MTSFRIRPRFRLVSPVSQPELLAKFKSQLAEADSPCLGIVIPGHVTLKIPAKGRHFWSPQLDLTLEDEGEGTLLRGLYGPSPGVWSFFALAYLALGLGLFFLLVVAFSAYSLGNDTNVLWWVPVFLGIGVGLYFMSQMGQKLGADQLFTLHHFTEQVLQQKIGIK